MINVSFNKNCDKRHDFYKKLIESLNLVELDNGYKNYYSWSWTLIGFPDDVRYDN